MNNCSGSSGHCSAGSGSNSFITTTVGGASSSFAGSTAGGGWSSVSKSRSMLERGWSSAPKSEPGSPLLVALGILVLGTLLASAFGFDKPDVPVDASFQIPQGDSQIVH